MTTAYLLSPALHTPVEMSGLEITSKRDAEEDFANIMHGGEAADSTDNIPRRDSAGEGAERPLVSGVREFRGCPCLMAINLIRDYISKILQYRVSISIMGNSFFYVSYVFLLIQLRRVKEFD